MVKYLIAFTACFLLVSESLAQYGSLDYTFSGDGITTLDMNDDDIATAVAVQPDSKILVAGYTSDGGAEDLAVVRFNYDGSLDNAFANNGILQLSTTSNSDERIYDMGIDSSGSIFLAGSTRNNSNSIDKFLIVKCKNTGILDSTFNGKGWANTSISGDMDIAYAMALQPDGKIVLGGVNTLNNGDIGFARYKANGSLDTSFSNDGKTSVSYLDDYGGVLQDLKIQPDGKIVGCGYEGTPSGDYDIMVVRLNPDGSPDSSFNTTGYLVMDYNSEFNYGWTLDLRPDGRILVGGSTFENGSFKVFLLQLLGDGTLDPAFGTGGITTLYPGSGGQEASALKILPDSGILICGLNTSPVADFALIRCKANGTLDSTFGNGGITITDFNFYADQAMAMALTPDNKVVLSGYSKDFTLDNDFAVARYDNDFATSMENHHLNESPGFGVFPNPAGRELTLRFEQSTNSNVTITIKSCDKRVSFTAFNGYCSAGKFEKQFTLPPTVIPGFYLIEVLDDHGLRTSKLLIAM
ncbi:MAG TPA: delta-60 repeat domain-containing protein [Chitinophagales bacterium]|nr:delta-60 repeat domain-containing protein [Chitinophagales bacterium]